MGLRVVVRAGLRSSLSLNVLGVHKLIVSASNSTAEFEVWGGVRGDIQNDFVAESTRKV